ncbi:hypothetical protein QTO08_10385 [Vibrio parahaemolyticus]
MVKGLNPTIIEQIESICAERGVRLTPQRRRVFELICSNRRASSAYELLEQLKEENAEKHGFKLTNQVIETHGECQACSSETKEKV